MLLETSEKLTNLTKQRTWIFRFGRIKPGNSKSTNNSTLIIDWLIRRPLLAKGTKAAGLDLVRLLTISGHAFSHQAISCYLFLRSTSDVDPPRQIPIPLKIMKILLFSNLFSRPKKSEKRDPRPPKNDKNRFRQSLKTISTIIVFL